MLTAARSSGPCCGAEQQHSERAGAAAARRDPVRIAPAVRGRVADPGRDVRDVTLAPRAGEALRVRAAVAGGAAPVRREHRPALRHEVLGPRPPGDGALPGRSAVDVDQQRRAGRAPRPAARAATTARAGGCRRRRARSPPRARRGRPLRTRRRGRGPGPCGRPPRRGASPRLGCAHRTAPRARPAGPQSRPWCQPRACSSACPSRTTSSRPKPSSLRVRASAAPSGDQANDRCPGPHGGSACSAGSSHAGVGSVPSRRSTHTFHQPLRSLT